VGFGKGAEEGNDLRRGGMLMGFGRGNDGMRWDMEVDVDGDGDRYGMWVVG
jgi:hypothetical protein